MLGSVKSAPSQNTKSVARAMAGSQKQKYNKQMGLEDHRGALPNRKPSRLWEKKRLI